MATSRPVRNKCLRKGFDVFSNELSNDNTFNTSGALAHSDQNHTGGLRMSGGDHDDQSQEDS